MNIEIFLQKNLRILMGIRIPSEARQVYDYLTYLVLKHKTNKHQIPNRKFASRLKILTSSISRAIQLLEKKQLIIVIKVSQKDGHLYILNNLSAIFGNDISKNPVFSKIAKNETFVFGKIAKNAEQNDPKTRFLLIYIYNIIYNISNLKREMLTKIKSIELTKELTIGSNGITKKEEEILKEIKENNIFSHFDRFLESTEFDLSTRDIFFEEMWQFYPRKLGKMKALTKFKSSISNLRSFALLLVSLSNYLTYTSKFDLTYIKHASTWFNEWENWVYVEVKHNKQVCRDFSDIVAEMIKK